ncbi:AAA family ATPase [Azospirillum melinis]|uniref:AAA family ATPase n=1 Tax=Azospirillum melinis TaxID=328839 RepID=UPI00157AFF75|nr:AAA family ATPase [Azospirillum melinis]MBP2304747.1 putative ATPase [Azospirillum melinis]
MLRSIVESFVKVNEPLGRERSLGENVKKNEATDFSYKWYPTNVIALSTSPFDRFPISRESYEDNSYRYLGLRGLYSNNLSLSFMSRTLWALLRAITMDINQAKTVKSVLKYMGYTEFIEARFVCSVTRSRIDFIVNSEDPIETLLNMRNSAGMSQRERLAYQLDYLPKEKIIYAIETVHRWFNRVTKPRLDLRIDAEGVYDITANARFDESLLLLFELGFFQLKDVGLLKEGHKSLIRINDASSGEQCVLMAILGIASHIQDGSLICIDEPEICLHPEWQERYIDFLMNAFSQYRNCHFIIATHSPQIVAKLRSQNCFVLDLESGSTTIASELNGRSADFQLARIFRAPGSKNEYLSRILFNALQVIGSGQEVQSEKIDEAKSILFLKDMITKEDPVRGLMDILEKALEEIKK